MYFIFEQAAFFASIILTLFIPGYFLLSAIEQKIKIFTNLEKFILSFGLSIVIADFLMIFLGKFGIPISRTSIFFSIILFSAICFAMGKLQKHENSQKIEFNFSNNQTLLIILLVFLTIFIKTAYLKNSVFPTSTDLGHHMYWSEDIMKTGKLPVYAERNIVSENGNYKVTEPQKIADFVIGEHLIFSAISLISKISIISYFPTLVLLLVNIFSILAVFVLALRFFENHPQGKNIAIATLFLLGPLYAISSPQAKFASGGVIGNVIGNLLLPIALYFIYRFLKEKSSLFLSLAIFSALGMAYTHHLTTFIFIFILIFSVLIFTIFNFRKFGKHLITWTKAFLSPSVIALFIFSLLLLTLIYTPTYLDKSAIDTAVGTPEKSTRTGLSFQQLSFTAGEARMSLGILGILLLLFTKRKKYYSAILLGWAGAIFAMSLKPSLLFVDIPSARIASYISYPLGILGAFGIVYIFSSFQEKNNILISRKFGIALSLVLFTFIIWSGFYDNSGYLKEKNNSAEAIQTFHASKYLSEKSERSDNIVKDHAYISSGDAWIKIFFMRDYGFPFSRGLLKRYEDNPEREMCTLWMISSPNTDNGKKCFSETQTNFVMVNPLFDSAQFEKSESFWKIYDGKEINIFYRNF